MSALIPTATSCSVHRAARSSATTLSSTPASTASTTSSTSPGPTTVTSARASHRTSRFPKFRPPRACSTRTSTPTGSSSSRDWFSWAEEATSDDPEKSDVAVRSPLVHFNYYQCVACTRPLVVRTSTALGNDAERSDTLQQLCLSVSVVMGRNALHAFGQQFTGCPFANVAQTEDADHSLALVNHRQPADLQRLHVPHRLGEVVILAAAMDARGHHIARRRTASIETVLRQSFADDVAVGYIPISRSFSSIGSAPTSFLRINFAISMMGVSGPTHSTPLCIASLTFMADLRTDGLLPSISIYNIGSCGTRASGLRGQSWFRMVERDAPLVILQCTKERRPL